MKNLLLLSVAFLLVCNSAYSAVVWSEEFDGPTIDTDTWIWDVAGWGFGNGQMEYDTSRSKNSYIENGSLVIEAFREDYFGNSFTSARLQTQGRFAFKYGTLEARIKFPDTANGLWPAFWLLGNNFPGIDWPGCGEIDIVEMGSSGGIADGKQQERLNSAIHYSNATPEYEYAAEWIDATVDLSQDYHLYKVEWTPTNLKFFLDGVQFANWDITPEYLSEFHQPHFVILNLAIGGWDPSYTGVYSPAGVTALPTAGSSAKMKVDWIRLEDNGDTEIFLNADTAEDGNFGVFTETTPVTDAIVYTTDDTDPAFEYGAEAALYIWENTMTPAETPTASSEGDECWSFDIGGAGWFGMGVFLPNFRNMKNYSDGFLHFDINTTVTGEITVGLKSFRGGEYWLPVGDETDDLGFARDGNWHTVSIPLNGYANIDFNTVHQMFMITGTGSYGAMLSIDNVWWEPSAERPTPENGSFGVYTETAAHKDAGVFELGVNGEFYVWGDTLVPVTQNPYEGSESLSYTSAAGLAWFGEAFTPKVKYNLTAFRYPESKLRFSMKTSSSVTFYVGMKSGNVIGPDSPWGANTGPAGMGQVWIKFAAGSDPYGFVRDGNWHVVEIPMSDIVNDIDLSQVSQLFQILGIDGAISDIEIDDVYFTGGGSALTESGNVAPAVSITSPADGTLFNSGDDILIIADANDPDGTITKVEFFEGLNLLGEDTTEPYSYTWASVPEGQYALTAVATDSNDVSRTSAAVTVNVGTPELTTIDVSPAATTIAEGTVVLFTASGFDQFGQAFPAAVEWSVSGGGVIDENGWFAAIDAGEAYMVTATEAGGILSGTAGVDVSAGGLMCDYDVSGKVDLVDMAELAWYWLATNCDEANDFCDGVDHVGDGDVDFYDLEVLMVSWLKSLPPSVAITNPANGSSFEPGDDVTIDAAVVVNASGIGIAKVEFFEGNHYLGDDTTEPYSYTWVSVPEGVYVLTAVVTDNTGRSGTSEAVTISAGGGLVNGGFETGDTAGWTPYLIGAGSTIDVLTESPLSGDYSAKLVTNWQGGTGVKSELLQVVDGLSGNTSYDFEFWVKGSMGVGGVSWAEIHWLDDNDTFLGGTGLINVFAGLSDTAYQARGGTYTSPAGTTRAKLSIRIEGGALAAVNTMYVDDVSFE